MKFSLRILLLLKKSRDNLNIIVNVIFKERKTIRNVMLNLYWEIEGSSISRHVHIYSILILNLAKSLVQQQETTCYKNQEFERVIGHNV